jgi:hypothetical protein
VSAPAGRRVPNANTAGAVGSWQVTPRDGAAFGRFPAANIGLLSAARRHKSRNIPCPPHLKNRSVAQ